MNENEKVDRLSENVQMLKTRVAELEAELNKEKNKRFEAESDKAKYKGAFEMLVKELSK